MKKLIFSLVTIFAFGFSQAQTSFNNQLNRAEQEGHFKVGANLGIPMGDIDDFSSIAFGFDLAYLWPVAERFKAGATVGYLNFVGKKYHGSKRQNIDFIPIAATGQYSITQNIFVGADLGYGIGLSPSGNDGGFYYQPKVGYQIDLFEVYLGYKGVTKNHGNAAALSIGFNYKF